MSPTTSLCLSVVLDDHPERCRLLHTVLCPASIWKREGADANIGEAAPLVQHDAIADRPAPIAIASPVCRVAPRRQPHLREPLPCVLVSTRWAVPLDDEPRHVALEDEMDA